VMARRMSGRSGMRWRGGGRLCSRWFSRGTLNGER
jgi:hypothetical protein